MIRAIYFYVKTPQGLIGRRIPPEFLPADGLESFMAVYLVHGIAAKSRFAALVRRTPGNTLYSVSLESDTGPALTLTLRDVRRIVLGYKRSIQ